MTMLCPAGQHTGTSCMQRSQTTAERLSTSVLLMMSFDLEIHALAKKSGTDLLKSREALERKMRFLCFSVSQGSAETLFR